MSSVTSNANNPDFNVYNTVVSEAAVNAVLGPMNLENLMFASNTNPNHPIDLQLADHTLTVEDLVQAVNGKQQLLAHDVATTRLMVLGGADTSAVAAKLQLLLGITETNRYRELTFVSLTPANDAAVSGVVQVSNGTGTAVNVIFNDYILAAALAKVDLYDVDTALNGVVKRLQAYCAGDDVTGDFKVGSEKIRFRLINNPATGKV